MCFVKQRSAEEEETGAFSRIGWRGMIIIEILHFCVYTLCIQIMCVYDRGKASACHSHDNNASELMTCVRRRPGALAHLCGQDWTKKATPFCDRNVTRGSLSVQLQLDLCVSWRGWIWKPPVCRGVVLSTRCWECGMVLLYDYK